MSTKHRAYVTICMGLTDGEERGDLRLTEMRYRDMTIDNIVTTGGGDEAMTSLRFLATKFIMNDAARETIADCFRGCNKDITKPGDIEILPSDKCFEKCLKVNPFARGAKCMLKHRRDATAHAVIKRLIFISDGLKPSQKVDFMNPPLHMLCELEHPGQS